MVIPSTRYMGHFCGAVAGFLVGLVLLENRKVSINPLHISIAMTSIKVETWEIKLKVVSVCVYMTLLLSAILWHLVRLYMYRSVQ